MISLSNIQRTFRTKRHPTTQNTVCRTDNNPSNNNDEKFNFPSAKSPSEVSKTSHSNEISPSSKARATIIIMATRRLFLRELVAQFKFEPRALATRRRSIIASRNSPLSPFYLYYITRYIYVYIIIAYFMQSSERAEFGAAKMTRPAIRLKRISRFVIGARAIY